jgi:hypothetical protein
MRPLLAGLFALALGSTVLAGDGLVLVPHTHALGEPAVHPHGLALYRFPIALLGAPPDAPRRVTPSDGRASFELASPFGETLVGAALLIVGGVAVVALLPLVASRSVHASLPVPSEQWSPLARPRPPRRWTLPH